MADAPAGSEGLGFVISVMADRYPARTDPPAGGRSSTVGTSRAEEAAVRIVDVREKTFPISSPIRNAYIDFSRMTLSLVAVPTDEVRDGRPSSVRLPLHGRYGQGLCCASGFVPRLSGRKPRALGPTRGVTRPHRSGPP
jgi:hypothetical protein